MRSGIRAKTFMAVCGAAAAVGMTGAPAMASEQGQKNTALALGAAAVALLTTQHNKLPGLLAAGAAAVAYKQYSDTVNRRHAWEQQDGWNRDQCTPLNGNYNGYGTDNGGEYQGSAHYGVAAMENGYDRPGAADWAFRDGSESHGKYQNRDRSDRRDRNNRRRDDRGGDRGDGHGR